MNALRPERLRAKRRGHCGVDPARYGDDDLREAVLLDVVAEAELERGSHLLELGGERGDRPGDLVRLLLRRRKLDLLHGRRVLARAIQLAAARVSETTPDRGDRLDVDDEQVLLEPRCAGDDLTGVVEDDRVPVEDELVLAADEVAEREVGARVARPRDEHLLPLLGLADVERRRGEVDDELRAGEREVGRRRPGLPDVLADRDPDRGLPESEDDELAALGEVAVLVEHAVVRQEVLAVHALNAPVGAHGTRVREIAVEPGRPDERHDAVRRRGDLLDRLPCGAHEPRAEEEILGRVARGRELRKHDEIGMRGACLGDPREDRRAIALEVADDAVDLRQSEPQGFSLTVTNLSLVSSLSPMEVTFPHRYRGPLTSANGGYACGRLAAFVDAEEVEVTLRLPPPLDRALAVERDGDAVLLRDGDAVVAEARPAAVEIEPPAPVSIADADARARAARAGVDSRLSRVLRLRGTRGRPGDPGRARLGARAVARVADRPPRVRSGVRLGRHRLSGRVRRGRRRPRRHRARPHDGARRSRARGR